MVLSAGQKPLSDRVREQFLYAAGGCPAPKVHAVAFMDGFGAESEKAGMRTSRSFYQRRRADFGVGLYSVT